MNASNWFFKGFHFVLAITPRMANIGPRFSKKRPRPDLLSERGVYLLAWLFPGLTVNPKNLNLAVIS